MILVLAAVCFMSLAGIAMRATTYWTRVLVGFLFMSLLSIMAHAETAFVSDKPAGIKASEAAKLSKQHPVAKCDKVKQGPGINPVKVPGSSTVWLADLPKGIDNAGDVLADGKTLYRCKTMAIDTETARMKSATL